MKELDVMAHRLLGIGTLAGALIALVGLISDHPARDHQADAPAYVNGQAISPLHIQEIAEKLPPSLSAEERYGRALEQAINDILLLQAAEELDLSETDTDIQTAIIQNLVERYAYLDGVLPASEAEIEKFYTEAAPQFAPVKAIRIEHIFVSRGEEADARLSVIRSAIMTGESFKEIATRLGDPSPINFPRALMSMAQLNQMLPPALFQYILRLKSGAVTDAIETKQGWMFIHIAERETGAVPTLDEIRPTLEDALIQKILRDTQLTHIERLKQQAEIEIRRDANYE